MLERLSFFSPRPGREAKSLELNSKLWRRYDFCGNRFISKVMESVFPKADICGGSYIIFLCVTEEGGGSDGHFT